VLLDHAVDGVSATSTDAHDLHTGVLCGVLLEFEYHRGEKLRNCVYVEKKLGLVYDA